MTVKAIAIEWLKANKYDGLFTEDCVCLVDDLMPCTGCAYIETCEAGIVDVDGNIGPKEVPHDES